MRQIYDAIYGLRLRAELEHSGRWILIDRQTNQQCSYLSTLLLKLMANLKI